MCAGSDGAMTQGWAIRGKKYISLSLGLNGDTWYAFDIWYKCKYACSVNNNKKEIVKVIFNTFVFPPMLLQFLRNRFVKSFSIFLLDIQNLPGHQQLIWLGFVECWLLSIDNLLIWTPKRKKDFNKQPAVPKWFYKTLLTSANIGIFAYLACGKNTNQT